MNCKFGSYLFSNFFGGLSQHPVCLLTANNDDYFIVEVFHASYKYANNNMFSKKTEWECGEGKKQWKWGSYVRRITEWNFDSQMFTFFSILDSNIIPQLWLNYKGFPRGALLFGTWNQRRKSFRESFHFLITLNESNKMSVLSFIRNGSGFL